MRPYTWLITKDHVASPDAKPGTNANAVGLRGPKDGLPLTLAEIRYHPKAERFRLLDDDGEIYYEGLIVNSLNNEFAPLDDFGTPNAGATTIQYHGPYGWKTL